MLLNSADTWDQISDATVKKIDSLQNTMIQYIFDTRRTCPQPILNWDSGMFTASYRIIQKKLNLLFHLSQLDSDTLAKETLEVQKRFGFPGLATEMKPWITKLGIGKLLDEPNSISKASFGKRIKEDLRAECERELIEKMKGYKKLAEGPIFNNGEMETFNRKPYIDELPLAKSKDKIQL